MPLKILYVDLRVDPSKFEDSRWNWSQGLTARKAIEQALGEAVADQIVDDLAKDNKQLTVSWTNKATGEHSEVGGVGSLDWEIPDNSIVTAVYENQTTTQEKMNEAIEWMLKNETE